MSVTSRTSGSCRSAILDTFATMVTQARFAKIRVGDIIRAADVSRSTFYEHFRNKEDLLQHSAAGLLSILADCVFADSARSSVIFVVEHIQEHRDMARDMLNGPAARPTTERLAELIANRLTHLNANSEVAVRLVAGQIAEAQLGLLRTWLNLADQAPPSTIADQLRQSSLALANGPAQGVASE